MSTLAENRKAHFNYQVLEEFEAGLVLLGTEVKSIRAGKLNLAGSYVVLKDSEFFLVGANIPAYQPQNTFSGYNPGRPRKLLLGKKEINYLIGKSRQRGLTLMPLKVYTKNAKIKLAFGVAKGKKKFDKREAIKKRETEREIRTYELRS